MNRVAITFWLTDTYGIPPSPGIGTLLGAPGQTEAELLNTLTTLYQSRLIKTKTWNNHEQS